MMGVGVLGLCDGVVEEGLFLGGGGLGENFGFGPA